jgi:hypothetical protein
VSPELDQKLCEKYPKIFKDRHGDPKETLMCFGFEVDDGWFNLIDTMCSLIQHNIDHSEKTFERQQTKLYDWETEIVPPVPQVVAVQVKEKFGGLRFYYDGGDQYIRGVVSMACSLSNKTCEVCGNTGSHTSGGWIRTLCEAHKK